jgi:hypothetical protein
LQQIVIEFASADPEADGTMVGRLDGVIAPDHPHAKPLNGLEDSPLAIVAWIDPEIVENLRRDPPGTDLVARKDRPVDDDDVEARLTKLPRTTRPRWTTTDNGDVTRIHHASATFSR